MAGTKIMFIPVFVFELEEKELSAIPESADPYCAEVGVLVSECR